MRTRLAVTLLALIAACGSERCTYTPWLVGTELGDRPCLDVEGRVALCATAVFGIQTLRLSSFEINPRATIVVDGMIFERVSEDDSPPAVRVRARAAGDADVELRSGAESQAVPLRARPLARASLVTVSTTGGSLPMTAADYATAGATVLVAAGVIHNVTVALFADDGTRLVDESLKVTADRALPLPAAGASWSALKLPALDPDHELELELGLDALAEPLPIQVIAVDHADRLEPVALPAQLTAGANTTAEVCVVARQGDAPILGAPLEFVASGAIELVGRLTPGCVAIRGRAAGQGQLAVSGLAAQASFPVTVQPSSP